MSTEVATSCQCTHEPPHRFEIRGGYTLDQRVDEALSGLGFAPADVRRPAAVDQLRLLGQQIGVPVAAKMSTPLWRW